jgi:hypothetical protein
VPDGPQYVKRGVFAVVGDQCRGEELHEFTVQPGERRPREAARLDQLPLYFRTLNVRLASEATPVNSLIDDYLRSLKGGAENRPTRCLSTQWISRNPLRYRQCDTYASATEDRTLRSSTVGSVVRALAV